MQLHDIYVHITKCARMHTHTYMHACAQIRTHAYPYMHACTYTYVHHVIDRATDREMHKHTNATKKTRTHARRCMHTVVEMTYKDSYMHTHTCTHKYYQTDCFA